MQYLVWGIAMSQFADRYGRAVVHFFIQILVFALIYLGIFQEVNGAQNILLFYLWLMFVFSLFLLSESVTDSLAEDWSERFHLPIWVDFFVDVAIVLILIWFEWWWTGAVYTFAALMGLGTRVKLEESS